MSLPASPPTDRRLRSSSWFDNPNNEELTELYVARYLNYGLTREELQSNRPVIGISQTGSDIAPCNRHHLSLVARIKDGIRAGGGIPMEFPVHPIQETCRRPAAALDRNLAFLGLVEVLNGYPLDGVVLTTGCDKTTPAALMAAATVDMPAIVYSTGPMLNGWHRGERIGSGTIFFKARALHASGEIDDNQYRELLSASAPSVGHCNTMGTAATMNIIAEAMGMALPGSAMIPAPYRGRGEMGFATGRRIVGLVREQLLPSAIMTREAFENAITVASAVGGSTNAPVHLIAIAKHAGVDLGMEDWQAIGADIPLLVSMMPAGPYLAEDFHRAGGVPAVMSSLLEGGFLHGDLPTVSGATVRENCSTHQSSDEEVIRPVSRPFAERAGIVVLRGNFFSTAVMKVSTMAQDFRDRYLSNPNDPLAFEGSAVVFEGPEDYRERIDDPATDIHENSILVMRGVGPLGFPGSGEVVNMRPPERLIRKGIETLPCLGDGRQSGTSGAPSILNVSPESAAGGRLALIKTGDRIRVDLLKRRVDADLSEAEFEEREQARATGKQAHEHPRSTPWEDIQSSLVEQLEEGMVLRGAAEYRGVVHRGVPRENY